jgi:hypothetical protein
MIGNLDILLVLRLLVLTLDKGSLLRNRVSIKIMLLDLMRCSNHRKRSSRVHVTCMDFTDQLFFISLSIDVVVYLRHVLVDLGGLNKLLLLFVHHYHIATFLVLCSFGLLLSSDIASVGRQ